MCGFAGIYEYGRTEGAVTSELVRRMRDTVAHRGPDGEGEFVAEDRRVGLGHQRLAIVDLVGGAQPMFGAQGECLVFNGEIYNYPRLRRDLERDGARFVTSCDTEVILHLYARHGLACVEHLNGMFAFALWDPSEQRMLLARDHIGEKPLYWADRDGRIVFGSEIKALLEHPAFQAEVNDAVLPAFLTNLVSPSPSTLYRGIFKLSPGTMAVCDADGVRVTRFWDVFRPRAWDHPVGREASVKVRDLLQTSLDDRLMSDVPVGVLLSGGLDSTTLVALLQGRAQGLATFSVGFEGRPDIDERAEAQRVAAHFGTDHHEVTIGESDALKFLPGLVHHQDEPLADPVCIPLNFVCRLARANGIKVVLAGEGADELFWGYPQYQRVLERWRYIRTILALPPWLRSQVPRMVRASRHPYARELLDGVATGRPLPAHLPLGLSRFDQREILRNDHGLDVMGWRPSNHGEAGERPLERFVFDTQEYEFGLRLPELLLMRIDRFSMANGVEARVPFLDPDLVNYVYRLPLDQKLRADQTKIVLRRAVADIVPPWVLNRRKQGFGAPVVDWLGTRFGEIFRMVITSESMRRYFATDALLRALDENRRLSRKSSLWPVLNFALWHRHWIEGESLDPLLERLASPSGRE